jgi:hypothetical protein
MEIDVANPKNPVLWLPVGLALGVAVGVAMKNLALGIGLGLAVGGLATLLQARRSR